MMTFLAVVLWLLVWTGAGHAYHDNLREAGRGHRQEARRKGVIEEESKSNSTSGLQFGMPHTRDRQNKQD